MVDEVLDQAADLVRMAPALEVELEQPPPCLDREVDLDLALEAPLEATLQQPLEQADRLFATSEERRGLSRRHQDLLVERAVP